LYGISKFPLIYVSSPQGERMEVRGLSSAFVVKEYPPKSRIEHREKQCNHE